MQIVQPLQTKSLLSPILMFKKQFFWLLILCSFSSVNSQNSFNEYEELLIKLSANNVDVDVEVDKLINNEISKDSINSAIKIIHDYSLKLYKAQKYSKGLKYVFWEKDLYEKYAISNKKYISVLFNGGFFSFKDNQ